MQQAALHGTFPARPPSGVVPSSESVHPAAGVNLSSGVAPLLGFIPSKGLPGHAMELPSQPLLSHTFTPVRSAARRPLHSPSPVPQSIPPRNLWLASEEAAVLPGVCYLFTLHILLELASPWLMVSPQAPEYVTASRQTLFGLRSFRPE
jgi:hypothetical protein